MLSIGLLAGNGIWIALNVAACLAVRRWDLVPAALASPIAWLLHGLPPGVVCVISDQTLPLGKPSMAVASSTVAAASES